MVRSPDQHHNYDRKMNQRPADEHWNSPGVLRQTAERQREECVGSTEADHDEADTMDSQDRKSVV